MTSWVPRRGQHSPQSAGSPLQGSPASGSRPHQQTGSGSAKPQFHRPDSQVQNIPPPHWAPSEHVAPSVVQADPGALGSRGSMPAGQLPLQVVTSTVPGGQTHTSPTQTVVRTPSPSPHSLVQTGLGPSWLQAGPASSGSSRVAAGVDGRAVGVVAVGIRAGEKDEGQNEDESRR